MASFKGKTTIMINGLPIDGAVNVEIHPATSDTLKCPVVETYENSNINLTFERIEALDSVVKRLLDGQKEKIFFWSQKDKYGAFSNFYHFPFEVHGLMYKTVEHFYQSQKAVNQYDQWLEIVNAKTPKMAKYLGSKVVLPIDWEDQKYSIMLQGVRLKFYQNSDLTNLLISTGDAIIYEDSPYDKIWGTGKRGGIGSGKNLLGKILMEVRSELQKTHATMKDTNNA